MDFQKIAIFTIDNYTNILCNLIWWRSGPKGTIYTRPDESPFFCPPTKNLVSSGYNHLFGVCSVFRSSTVVCNDSLHHFWLIVDENLPTRVCNCNMKSQSMLLCLCNYQWWKSQFFKKSIFYRFLYLKFHFGHQKYTSQKWCLEVRRTFS